MKSFLSISSAAILFAAMVSGAGCKKSSPSISTNGSQSGYQVSLMTSAALGQYLVDKDGRSLYFFSNDPAGKDNCTRQCQLYWPVFNVAGLTAAMLGSGLDLADFG